jgi:hypothetical protein
MYNKSMVIIKLQNNNNIERFRKSLAVLTINIMFNEKNQTLESVKFKTLTTSPQKVKKILN